MCQIVFNMADKNEPEPEEAKPLPVPILDVMVERGYTLLKKIGQGSYASVYITKYQPDNIEKRVMLACKLIDTRNVPKHFAKKFLPREINIMKKIEHPNIIAVHSIFAQNTIYLIFMNYASKGDLLNFIMTNGAIKELQAYIWFRQVTDAVHYLHELGIAHRDLKCENLLLTSRYIVKLSDFGFSRFLRDENGVAVNSRTFCGSISYASPELISGTPYDPIMSDSWSLGVILFVMLNKAMPFDDSNIKHIYECQMQQNWHFRSKVTNVLSDDVKCLVLRLLQPKLEQRWNTKQVLESAWFHRGYTMWPINVGLIDEELEDLEQAEDIEKTLTPTEGVQGEHRPTSSVQVLTHQ